MKHDNDFGDDDFENDNDSKQLDEKYVRDLCEIASEQYELENYTQQSYKRFIAECYDAGFVLRHYNGRFYFKGPAVVTDDIAKVIRTTTVPVQWDNMGLKWIVYPK